MWRAHEGGTLPRPQLTNLDVYLEVGAGQALEERETQTMAAYHEHWLERLARRHAHRPVATDSRLISPTVLAAWG
jgi:hypothetical protein